MASRYRKKFELPENFYEILENYSREVLRDQPLDIIEFSYLYFKALEEVSKILYQNCTVFNQLDLSTVVSFLPLGHKLKLFNILQGTIDQFDYPKKGKNIPPSKHDAPPKEERE